MALESKPLFHPEVLRQQVRAFNLPERVADSQPKLQHWADLIASGRADDFKETALLRRVRTAPRLRIRRARTHQPVLRALRRHPPTRPQSPVPRELNHCPAGNPPLHSEAAGPRAVLRLLRRPRPVARQNAQARLRAPRPIQSPARLAEFPRPVPRH